MVVGNSLKVASKKSKAVSDGVRKAEIDEALAAIAPTTPRPRPKISPAEAERRILLAKAYSRHMITRDKTLMQQLIRTAASRDAALAELKALSPALFDQAMLIDNNVYPAQLKPMTDTPPKNA